MNRCKAFGKIKKRLEEAKNKWSKLSKVEFSHNESARLATDALLDGGLEAYQKVLNEEREVDFLSGDEVQHILKNVKEPCYVSENHSDGDNGSAINGNKSETYYPMHSENSEPTTQLHNWSSEDKPYLKDKSSATVYFQSDRTNNVRETIRRGIHKATQVLAIMMDEFTDPEIFCDLLEVANKRNIFVYLLLDTTKLHLFVQMCEKLQNISVRSVTGDVYCAKSGKKFSGQIHEKFIIIDWRTVLSGSYSFTWLSGQVHRNFLYKFTGTVVELFDDEFRHLYGSSKQVMGLKSPSPMTPVQRQENSVMSTMSKSSTRESINTTSEPFSCSSANSTSNHSETSKSPESLEPSTPITPTPSTPTPSTPTTPTPTTATPTTATPTTPVKSPLQRMNSFHGYPSLRSPPAQNGYQPNYFQRNYAPESPPFFLNNNTNMYRSVRGRQEDLSTPRFNPGWRYFSKPTMT
ncbi:protein FAM83A isoform 2-T2 [Rhinophrynus dorsalis]